MAYVCQHLNIVDTDRTCPACDLVRQRRYDAAIKCQKCGVAKDIATHWYWQTIDIPCSDPEGHEWKSPKK